MFLGCGFTALLCETVRTVGIANLLQSPHSVPELNMAGANASDKRAQLHRDLRHARQARRRFAASVQSQLAAGPHNEMGPAGFSHPKQVKSLELTAVARPVPQATLDEESFSDKGRYSSNRCEKVFVDYEAAHHYVRVMSESQLASLVTETANLYGLVRRAQDEEEAFDSIAVEVPFQS